MQYSRRFATCAAVATALLLSASSASATPFDFIRIGDVDGFGYSPTAGLVRTTGAAADTNGNGILEVGEFLPDRNANGATATGQGDDFDNRTAADLATGTYFGSGFTSGLPPAGDTGSKWTDVALSTSYATSGFTNFPDPAGPAVPNQPSFVFDFNVAGGDISTSAALFFNVLFGDYDVIPASIRLTFASAPQRTIALATQSGPADGLIQAAFTTLTFAEVFTANGSGWDGFLQVDFVAPNEPYTAFDFTELSLVPIAGAVPEPASIVLLTTGGLGLLARMRRRKK